MPDLGSLSYVLEGRSARSEEAVDAFSKVLREAARQTARDTLAPSVGDAGT